MLKQTQRTLFLICGLLSLATGIVGIFLPILPTVPFVLLAAFFFSKSSTTLHRWLLSQPTLGPLIRDWEQHHIIRLRAKILASVMLTAAMSYPILFKPFALWIKVSLVFIAVSTLVFIWTRPSHRPHRKPSSPESPSTLN